MLFQANLTICCMKPQAVLFLELSHFMTGTPVSYKAYHWMRIMIILWGTYSIFCFICKSVW